MLTIQLQQSRLEPNRWLLVLANHETRFTRSLTDEEVLKLASEATSASNEISWNEISWRTEGEMPSADMTTWQDDGA